MFINEKKYSIAPRANLSGANLSWANLSGANLSGANIGKFVLKNAHPIILGPLGSRMSQLYVWETEQGLVFQTGCFIGDQDDFLKAVLETHGDNIYGKQYRATVDFINALRAIKKEG